MSNEEIAVHIQEGDSSLIPELYERVQRLIYTLAYRFYNRHTSACIRAGVTSEDLCQEGYIAMLEAVKGYHRDKGVLFISYLDYPMKTRCNLLIGRRTSKRNPLNESDSLDEPLENGEDFARMDIIEDTTAAEAFEQVEEDIFTQELHAALESCLDRIEQGSVIRGRYYDSLSLDSLAVEYGISRERVRQLEAAGLRKLRMGGNLRILRPFADEIVSAKSYCGTGFSSWKYRGSVEERIAEWRAGLSNV